MVQAKIRNESAGHVDGRPPTSGRAAGSPTAICNLLASVIILTCFFIPHSIDFDNHSHRPIDILGAALSEKSPSEMLSIGLMFWPFAFAAGTFAVTIYLIFAKSANLAKSLLSLPVSAFSLLITAWLILLFNGRDESRAAMTIAAIVAPSGTCVAARIHWLVSESKFLQAATWGQGYLCVLSVFSLRWFWVPSISELRWGGYLAITGFLLMLVASWTWPTRAKHDLVDTHAIAKPFQMSILQIASAIMLSAFAITYWQLLANY